MTSKERMRVALEGGKPDRVPICLISDWDYLRRIDPRARFFSELYQFSDYDAFLADRIAAFRYHPACDVFWAMPQRFRSRSMERTRFHLEVRNDSLLAIDLHTGTVFDTERAGSQLFAVDPSTGDRTEILPPALSDFSKPYAILETTADVEKHFYPLMTTDEMRARGYYEFVRDAAAALGDDTFVTVGGFGVFPNAIPHAAGSHGLDGEGATRAYAAMIEKPDLFHSICRAVADQQALAIPLLAETGAHAVIISGYWDSIDMISPVHWREFSMPCTKLLVDAAHANGLKAIFWGAGYYLPVAADLINLGVDCLYLEPSRKGYSNHPGEYRKAVGPNVCIGGWLDEMDLVNNNRASIERSVREQIDAAGRDGAFIMCGTYLTGDTDPAAVEFMCEILLKHGTYA